MLTKDELLGPLARLRTSEIVVTSMSVVRPWARYSDSDLDFASADSAMGHTADLALGLALAQPCRKVICLNGDGSMAMTLGTLLTITESGAPNIVLIVIQNGSYEITGNQRIPGAGRSDLAAMAQGAGFERVYRFVEGTDYRRRLPEVLEGAGPVFAGVAVEQGSEGPITRSEREQARYLRTSLAEWSRHLRKALLSEEQYLSKRSPRSRSS
jgi:thiamine pyrophosphate-dependent acetolactate synthase large subunit-like protein